MRASGNRGRRRRRAWWRWAVHRLCLAYGGLAYRLGRDAGYYWALRATCNWAGLDWYGRPTGPVFYRVGWIRW